MDMVVHSHIRDVAGRITAGNAHAQGHDWPQAATEYRTALALDERSVEAANNLGYVLYLNQHGDQAIALYLRALAIDPDFGPARRNLLHSVLERVDEARVRQDLAGARRWIAIGLSALGPERELLVARGDLCLADDDFDTAITSYAAVLDHDRGDAQAWARVGETCDAAGDARRASGAYLTALQADGAYGAAHCTDEGVAAMRVGDYALAVRCFRRALREDAQYEPALDYLAWAEAAVDTAP